MALCPTCHALRPCACDARTLQQGHGLTAAQGDEIIRQLERVAKLLKDTLAERKGKAKA